ncbi:unnamed protein product [Arctia plantaginis]|uniref:Major facilitator superfamily (MFS) profile domain-containing protein n=1 Tax=Arctia plantaginis TaxID=874455 RepID=A0A8S1BJJ1_ARCPL|nr:unnamed protein product [Arctia plantaginis]
MEADEPGQLWRQYIIAGIVNIGMASTGYTIGWTSPAHPILKNATISPLGVAVTTDQEAWIGSLLAIGSIFGPFLSGYISSKWGYKWSLICSGIPLLLGWILIVISSTLYILYAARLFCGLGIGMLFTNSPLYCAEIATVDSRGALGSFLQLFNSAGFLPIYFIGSFASYNTIAYVGCSFVAVFCVGMIFMPESPMYHLTKNDKEAATKCLAKIRGRSPKAVQSELDKMNAEVTTAMARTATIKTLFQGNNLKAIFICCMLLFFQQFCGIDAVLFYLITIFDASGMRLESSIATIIIGIVLTVASGITSFVVDKYGRRLLLLISTVGTAISMGLLGMYFTLADSHVSVVDNLSFLPILSLVMYIVAFSIGLGPLPWALIGELLPIEVKNIASPIPTSLCWILMFFVTRFFSPIGEAIGMGPEFFTFGVFSILAFFFTLLYVPETKGKTFEEIQDILSGKSSRSQEKSKC